MPLINIKNLKNNIHIKPVMDAIYLCILGLYIMRKLFNITMFTINWPVWYYDFLRIAMILFLIVKIVVYDSKNMKAFIFDLLYLVVFYFVYKGTGYKFLLELGFFVLAAKNISYKKILRLHFCVVASIMAITILGALTGCIEDLVFVRNDMFKHAFGIAYTTDFAAQIFFLVITYLVWKERKPNFLLNIFLLFLAYVLYRYSGARNSSGCIVLLVIGGIYIQYSDKVILGTKIDGTWNRIKTKIIQIIDSFLIIAVPLLAIVTLLLTLYYSPDNHIMIKLNQISSGRLSFGKNTIDKYGFSLWGSPFDMIGIGSNLVTRTDYNFVDCSYVMICVRYGFVLFILTLLGFFLLGIKAKRAGKRYILLILAVMAIQSVMEHHLLDVFCNSLVLLIFADMKDSNQQKYYDIVLKQNRDWIKLLIGGIITVVIYLNRSKIISYGKTFVTILNLDDANRNIHFIIITLVSETIFILSMTFLWKLCLTIVEKKNKKYLFLYSTGIGFCVIFLLGSMLASNNIMGRKVDNYEKTLREGKNIIEQLNQIEGYKLYVDDIPYFYLKNLKIEEDIIPGIPYLNDGMKSVVITKFSNEMTHLLNTGYLCGQISDTGYLYTNDERVVKVLREAGIKLDDFYAAKRVVNLQRMAKQNKLSVDENGNLIINGSTKSVNKGPRITIYAGKLKVVYDIILVDTDITEGEVAKLQLTSYNGQKLVKEVIINKSDFDESNHCIFSLESNIQDSVGVDFLILANENTKLKLASISYEKIGKIE